MVSQRLVFVKAQTPFPIRDQATPQLARKALHLLFAFLLVLPMQAAETFAPASCEGSYPRHLQGICTNGKDAIYWSWTEAIVKTDLSGRILKKVAGPDHQGDLCYVDGKIYVAVNLGKFNRPAGEANSWVFIYDAETLQELERHAVPELVHGAGGMAHHAGRFIIIGGLPPGTNENYVYEYDRQFKFIKRHTLRSGYTLMGIQTVEHADGAWWFGCYGKPTVLLRADENFQFNGKWEFNAAVGIAHLGAGQFLIAENKSNKETGNTARIRLARPDAEKGMIFTTP